MCTVQGVGLLAKVQYKLYSVLYSTWRAKPNRNLLTGYGGRGEDQITISARLASCMKDKANFILALMQIKWQTN